MKKLLIPLLSIAVLSSSCATISNMTGGSSRTNLKDYRVETLANGLNILFIKDEHLPYITLNAFVMEGYAMDPSNQTGLTHATLDLLDKGFNNVSAENIASEIEQLGADYEADVSADYSNIELDGLAWHQDKLLNILSQLLLKPDFKEKEIQRYKSKAIAEVKQRIDQLNYLASEIYEEDFYKNHPYGHRDLGSIADIQKMKRHDIVNQYKNILTPDHTWIVVVGQFTDDYINRIEQTFSTWAKSSKQNTQLVANIEPIQGRQILLVNKSDAAQSEIRLGHKMISRQDPDYIPTMIANTIFGQGFSSRLMENIRVKQGLTYNISSDLDMRLLGSGFKIRTFTKNETAGKILTEIFKTYEKFQKDGVTQQELDVAKEYLVGKFPALIETPEKLAFNLMVLRIFGVSDDYLKNYQTNINAVTLKQVNDAIHKNFDPYNMKVVVVSNKDKVFDQLKGLGKITTVEASEYLK